MNALSNPVSHLAIVHHRHHKSFFVGTTGTLAEAIAEVKEHLGLPMNSVVRLHTQDGNVKGVIGASAWGHISCLTNHTRALEVTIEIVDVGSMEEVATPTDEKKTQAGQSSSSTSEQDSIAVKSAVTESLLGDGAEYVHVNTESTGIPTLSADPAVTDNYDELTSVRMTVVAPCYGSTLNTVINPHTTTLGDIKEAILAEHAKHDPRDCISRNRFCSTDVLIPFGDASPLVATWDTLEINWLKALRQAHPNEKSYRADRLAVQGWFMSVSYP